MPAPKTCPKCGGVLKVSKDGKWLYCPENLQDPSHNVRYRIGQTSKSAVAQDIIKRLKSLQRDSIELKERIEKIETDLLEIKEGVQALKELQGFKPE